MSNQTENKMIEVYESFIIHLLTEYDEDKIIYSKLIEIEGEELNFWFIHYFIEYVCNNNNYDYNDEDIDGIDFYEWYDEFINIDDIFVNDEETESIRQKLLKYYNHFHPSHYSKEQEEWKNILFVDFFQLHIESYLNNNELKNYIINLIDPIELK